MKIKSFTLVETLVTLFMSSVVLIILFSTSTLLTRVKKNFVQDGSKMATSRLTYHLKKNLINLDGSTGIEVNPTNGVFVNVFHLEGTNIFKRKIKFYNNKANFFLSYTSSTETNVSNVIRFKNVNVDWVFDFGGKYEGDTNVVQIMAPDRIYAKFNKPKAVKEKGVKDLFSDTGKDSTSFFSKEEFEVKKDFFDIDKKGKKKLDDKYGLDGSVLVYEK